MAEFIKNYIEQEKKEMDMIDPKDIEKAADILFEAWKHNKQIFIFGNGGSASTASHFACDLAKGTLQKIHDSQEKRFRVISLTDNVALMTAIANDISYDDIFSQQLHNYLQEGDVVIAITGSGNSPNIIKAIKLAKKFKAKTVAFLGFEGGKLKGIVDHCILVKSNDYGRIENCHLMLHHIITSYLKKKIKEL